MRSFVTTVSLAALLLFAMALLPDEPGVRVTGFVLATVVFAVGLRLLGVFGSEPSED
ncbi:hypothetical protein [Clavibacter tessellarius]|uniref:hypothetical protein n=1 Tax=Clavibacter tessellarius TaxID=31965 RepID=UPI0013FDFA01|nr:hypothetical protein [Clavibacter michiganensis]